MTYKFGILRLGDSDEDRAHNASLLGPNTLGIEVVKRELAARCGLGNMDPQHVEGGGRSSAAEAALAWELPPNGATIVTIRPDQDAFVAMAILMIRAMGLGWKIIIALIRRIGAVDRHGLSDAKEVYAQQAQVMAFDVETNAIQFLINTNKLSLENKLEIIGHVITDTLKEEGVDIDINDLASRLERAPRQYFTLIKYGREVGFVEGDYRQGRNFVNKRCNVGVVLDSAYTGEQGGTHRFTVVRKPGFFDRGGFERAINIEEARVRGISLSELQAKLYAWGGNSNIVSSPEGFGRETRIPKETVLRLVQQFAENGIVSWELIEK